MLIPAYEIYGRDKRIKCARIPHDALEQVSILYILVFAASPERTSIPR